MYEQDPCQGFKKLSSVSVATGYGQPSSTFYDCTLGMNESAFKLPADVEKRIQIEKFSSKVTKALYSNRLDPVGLASDSERPALTSLLAREYEDLEQDTRLEDSCTLVLLSRLSQPFFLSLLLLLLFVHSDGP